MKIKRDYPEAKMSLNEAIQDKLESRDYYAGDLETIKSKSNNCVEMIGQIVEMLYENRALTKENVKDLIGYGCTIVDE